MNEKLGFHCGSYLSQLANFDPTIWVIDGDLADSDGAQPFALQHPERFIQAGIAEQNMVSMAAGMAVINLRPWVFSFASFLCYRAYDQIRVSISQTNLPVTLIGSHAGGCGGKNGKTHLALNDITIMSSIPGISIWAPADNQDVKLSIDQISITKSPAYIRVPRDPLASIPRGNGIIRWIGNPSKIAIVSYGYSTHWALKVQKILARHGYEIGILHFNKIWPVDPNLIPHLLKKVSLAYVIEDHYSMSGLCTHLRNLTSKINFIPIGWKNDWHGQSGTSDELLSQSNLLPEQIVSTITN